MDEATDIQAQLKAMQAERDDFMQKYEAAMLELAALKAEYGLTETPISDDPLDNVEALDDKLPTMEQIKAARERMGI